MRTVRKPRPEAVEMTAERRQLYADRLKQEPRDERSSEAAKAAWRAERLRRKTYDWAPEHFWG
jgi:hypothetical protein